MVETVVGYGEWNRTAVQDSVLQFLKKWEHFFYRRQYKKLAEKSSLFHLEHGKYPAYPAVYENASILIFKPDDIGDAVYSLPAINALRKKFPKAKLYLLCQEKTKDLFERTGLFEQIVGVNPKTRWLRFQSIDLESALDRFPVETFDLAVFLRSYPAYFHYFKKIAAATKVQPRDPRLPSRSPFLAYVTARAHQSQQMLEIMQRISPEIEPSPSFPAFHWTQADQASVEKVFGTETPAPYIVVHPYARYETRRYPYEYWRTLLIELQKQTKHRVVIIGAKEDPAFELPGGLQVQGKLSLTETGYLISKGAALIGNESGPGHWASVMGIPTVLILSGHSHLSEWGPLGNHLVLKKEVPCENCYLRACPKYKVRCLTEMPPASIRDRIFKFLTLNGVPSC